MLRCLGILFFTLPIIGYANPIIDNAAMVVYQVEEDFETIKDDAEMAIADQGLIVSNTLHISEMLARTSKDLGFPKTVYGQAEALEFCSARLSHLMAQAGPMNLTACPFTIAIYTLADKPEEVFLAFRKPQLIGEEKAVSTANKAINKLLKNIVEATVE